MNIFQSLGWNFTRELTKRGFKAYDSHVKENVIDKDSKFQKKNGKYTIVEESAKQLKMWKEYVWDMEQEYTRPSNSKRKDQILLLHENISDADYELSRIEEYHPKIYEECKEIYLRVRTKLENLVK